MSYSACLQTASINLGCASSVGGILEAYLVAGDITGVTYNAQGAITGITGTGDIYTYQVQMEQSKRNQVKLMAQNRGLKGFCLDNNNTIWYLGNDFGGGWLSAGSGLTGTAFGDANQYSVTLQFFSRDPMTTLDGTLAQVVSGLTINP